MTRLPFTVALCLAVAAPVTQAQDSTRYEVLRRMLPIDGGDTRAVLLGDLDLDGDADLYQVQWGADRLALNDGTGRFEDATDHLPAEPHFTSDGALGDVDGDGDLDVVAAGGSLSDAQTRLYRNLGGAVFEDATDLLPVDSDTTSALELGDLDLDGDLDLWIANLSGPDRVYLGDGTGTFTELALAVPPFEEPSTAVALGDVDADGAPDALVGTRITFASRLFVNDGTAIFSDATAGIPAHLDDTASVQLGDVNGDRHLDALIGNSTDSSLPSTSQPDRLYLGDGSGTFVESADALPPGSELDTRVCRLVDVDGDGDLDAWFGAASRTVPSIFSGFEFQNGEPNRLALGDGAGGFVDADQWLPPIVDRTQAGAFADVDGDGDLDLVVGNRDADYVELGSGRGSFVLRDGSLAARWQPTAGVDTGDVNGDGSLDLVVGSRDLHDADARHGLLLGDGTGVFTDASAGLPLAERDAIDVSLGDTDADGDLDLLIANPYDGEFFPLTQDSSLYRNDGGGVFTDVSAALPQYLGDDRGVATLGELVDLNADGAADVLLGDRLDFDGGGDNLSLYLSDGAGGFTDASDQVFYLGNVPVAVAIGDVDTDGDPDIVVGTDFTWIFLLLNDGQASFTDASDLLPAGTGPGFTLYTILGDVDADGDLDLAFGRSSFSGGVTNHLFLGDGTGTFADATSQVAQHPKDGEVYLFADVDGDRDLDLVGPERLQLNDGAGTFTETPTGYPELPPGTFQTELHAVDLDRDGDVDLVAARAGQDVAWLNRSVQLAWRALPRLGQPLTLDVDGPALEAWVLLASTGTVEAPTAFGLLQLDPQQALFVAGGLLDAQGSASWTTSVPDEPALAGLVLHWQALVGPEPRLTNRERTTLSRL